MSLKNRIAEFDASGMRPPEVVAILRRGIDSVRDSGVVRISVVPRLTDKGGRKLV